MAMMKGANTVDEYIKTFPKDVQKLLKEVRTTVNKAAPEAEEEIKYGIPTLVLNGNLVHYGAYKEHIGFYPAPGGIEAFKKELSVYQGSKGTVKFPFDRPIPLALISKIVKFRRMQNLEKTALKKIAKKK